MKGNSHCTKREDKCIYDCGPKAEEAENQRIVGCDILFGKIDGIQNTPMFPLSFLSFGHLAKPTEIRVRIVWLGTRLEGISWILNQEVISNA